MKKKQTAVELLEQQLKERYSLMNSEPLFEQAKQMEKEQVEDAYQKGRFSGQTNWGYGNDVTAEQFYKETYEETKTKEKL
jgi:hypothetical protein